MNKQTTGGGDAGDYSSNYSRAGDVVDAQPLANDNNQFRHSIESREVDNIPKRKKRRRPLPGTWSDGICCWFTNLYPSCFCVSFGCHGCWLTAQLHEKTKCMGGGHGKWIVGIYGGILFLAIVLELANVLHGHIGWIPMIFIWLVGIPLRMHIIDTEKILDCYPSNVSLNYWAEVGAAVLLGPFSLCQIARHVYGYDEHDPFDGDARWDREDGWEIQDHPTSGLMENAV